MQPVKLWLAHRVQWIGGKGVEKGRRNEKLSKWNLASLRIAMMKWKPVLALIESADWHNNYYSILIAFSLFFFRRTLFPFLHLFASFARPCAFYLSLARSLCVFSILFSFFFVLLLLPFSVFLSVCFRNVYLHFTQPFFSWNSCVVRFSSVQFVHGAHFIRCTIK